MLRDRNVRSLLAIPLALGAIACQPQEPPQLAAVTAGSDSASQPTPVLLNGAGASFPALLYQRWFQEFNAQHPHIQVDFQPIGNGAGIQQVIAETVDFGASDIAMTDDDIAQVDRGVLLLPMTAGSIAIVYNLPGIESGLKLSREVYPKLFLGEITRWNDPAIAALNPDLELPDMPISLVHRSDGSGTTAVFTAHLSEIHSEWRDRVGSDLNVPWPAGVGIQSNAGVSAQVQQAEGAMGYVEYSYAQQLGLSVAALENQAGEYVLPDIDSAAQGINAIALPDDLRVFIPDPEGAGAYPIVTYSWLLAYKTYEDRAQADALRQVLQWALAEGQALSPELGYVPLAPDAIDAVTAAVAQIGT